MDQNSGLSLLLRKSSEEDDGISELVLENALTLLDLRRVAGFLAGEASAFGRTLGVAVDDEEEEEEGLVRLLLLEEDLKAETAMAMISISLWLVQVFYKEELILKRKNEDVERNQTGNSNQID